MYRVRNNILMDTLNLVQLARETARGKGNISQAERLTPVVNELRNIANRERERKTKMTAGFYNPGDFQNLLSANRNGVTPTISYESPGEKNRVVNSMLAEGMKDLDIARHLGIPRDEVRMILNLASMRPVNRRVK